MARMKLYIYVSEQKAMIQYMLYALVLLLEIIYICFCICDDKLTLNIMGSSKQLDISPNVHFSIVPMGLRNIATIVSNRVHMRVLKHIGIPYISMMISLLL